MPDTITVDVQIRQTVLNAAKARIALMQSQERNATGVTSTNLADVARNGLAKWVTERHDPPARQRATNVTSLHDTCPHCNRQVAVNADGWLRKHGPADNRCPRWKSPKRTKAPGPTYGPLRFAMPRVRYELIKDTIIADGWTVVAALTEQLITFAETGTY